MNQTAKTTDISELRYDQIIDTTRDRFLSSAPASIKFENEKGFAIQLLQNSPQLMQAAIECPHSLRQAITNIAAIGLSLNPAKKEAYLITRNVKVQKNPDKWQTKIFLEPGYLGLCNLATNTGSVLWVQAKEVCENDVYQNNGVDKAPKHEYNTFKDRGQVIGYYCIAKTHNGDYLTTEMSMDEIHKVRNSSDSFKKGFGPWIDWPGEQAKKTVIRRASKTWPKSDQFERLEQAVHISNENEGMESLVTAPTLNSYTADQKVYFDQLISNADHEEMFLFLRSLDQGVQSSLFNSFEKGTITKYKQIVRELESKGRDTLNACIDEVNLAASNNDDAGVLEIMEQLSANSLAYVAEHCSQEAGAMIRELQG